MQSIPAEKIIAILADYARVPTLTLAQIAAIHGVSEPVIARLVDTNGLPKRRRGCKKYTLPTAKHLQILEALTVPGSTYDAVGKACGGVSRQRVCQVVKMWKDRLAPGSPLPKSAKPTTQVKPKKSAPALTYANGNKIEWGGEVYTITRLDSQESGEVTDGSGAVIDPFVFDLDGEKARVVV